MTTLTRTTGIWGAALLALALPAVAPAQVQAKEQSDLTRSMGIDQKLGSSVPKGPEFVDETGTKRTFGSVLQGRPVLLVPMALRCQAGCLLLRDSLQKTLFRAENPNERKLIKKTGRNLLQVGQDFDVVFLSLDPTETQRDALTVKETFLTKIGYSAPGVTVLTGKLDAIRNVTDAIGFRYHYEPAHKVLNNATGSVILTPDGRASSYTIGNDFPTIVLERNLATAAANAIGVKADDTNMFGCVQLDPGVIARRGKIEAIYTAGGIVTMIVVFSWIGVMLRSDRNSNKDLGGQPGGA